MNMRKCRILLVACCLLIVCFPAAARFGYADPSLEETKKLLQKSLTVYELDREIERLTARETEIGAKLAQTERDIEQKSEQTAEQRKHAGKVLQAYYMGERDNIWMLLFSSRSFSEALVLYEYLNQILEHDRHTLVEYQAAFKELQGVREQLEQSEAELADVKNEFVKQRDRAVALQKEVDEQLKANPEAVAVTAQIQDLQSQWKEKGIPLFRSYFKAISEAMKGLPELITGPDRNKYFSGLTFHMTDEELNRFFRSKNKLFENMTFRFADGSMIAEGKDGDIEVSLKGMYTIENSPKNRLRFYISELQYNGFTLPDTTANDLEREFDLGFSPESYLSFVKAEEVKIEDGKLSIKLNLSFNPG